MDKKSKQIIKSIAKELLDGMGFECEIEIIDSGEKDNKFVCDIKTQKDANFIIGQNGDNLQALQHIVRLLVRKQIDENIKFILDVNSYKKDQESSVVELAQALAKEAISERKTVIMRPMSAYNRRIVHMLLAENEEVVTESIGDENERRVIIKPTSL
ncbi:MAG: R3H domain protein [Candidatus Moranbacteria bacterium GW2011_GWE1_35_17]|nr:MAG: R3H domain protein [Candidatus Moranbacteria bacterium GW2011_GWE1_35_17]KKP71849.1 MAG: R3H domain protein [Candidatus Moranbacteria bacterium GW2011_GWE2_35_164]KKP83113.1 MAG: R3H domain protein [Candidatus Moranbacteria bacterium GW2011_GWF2_35_54]KKP83545.1 MAG: R3H domain protein [Candidatus Moranbacteria bacterium GW2011_GWF1_35_5]